MTVIMILMVIVSVCFHEWAHAYVAYLLGDKTAYYLKRLSLNPLRHIDIIGSIVVPVFLVFSGTQLLFGWAKPVPVNANYFKNPRQGMVWVAMAGPLINIILALSMVCCLNMLHFFDLFENLRIISQFCIYFIYINVVLALFNLIPIPPLDGSYLILRFIPKGWGDYVQKYSFLGVFFVVLLLSLDRISNFFSMIVTKVVSFFLLLNFSSIFNYAIFLFFFSFYTIGYKRLLWI